MDLEEILDLPPAELQQFLGGVEPDPALEAGLPKLPVPETILVACKAGCCGGRNNGTPTGVPFGVPFFL